MKVLIACECSGTIREAFAAQGHYAWSCDLQPSDRAGNHIQDNVLNHLNDGWDMMIAHPPCTRLAICANKWYKPEYSTRFPNIHEERVRAVEFFMAFANAPIEKICIENPVGIMSSRWRKSDQIIQPFEFGHPEPKKTCLWLKNLPKLQATCHVTPEYFVSKSGKRLATWYYMPSQTPERQKMRSVTFQGIADAMANQWGTKQLTGNIEQQLYLL